MFISPLFNENLLDKEINIVHQEYLEGLNLRGFKAREILSLVSGEGHHPIHRFAVGDNTTLRKAGLRDQLLHFFHTKYFAQNVSIESYALQ